MSEKKAFSRNIALALGVICIILVASLAGTIANYGSITATNDRQIETLTNQRNQLQAWLYGNITCLTSVTAKRDQLQLWLDGNLTSYQIRIDSLNSQISSLNSQIMSLQTQVYSLHSQISLLNSQITNLQTQIDHLNEIADSLTGYFLVQDSDFATPLAVNPFWGVEAWHENNDSICEIRNGDLHLFYDGINNDSYGNSGVFQGTHTYGGFTHQLQVADSPENSYYSDCVILPRDMPSGEFWLETNFTITDMGFNCYPIVYDPTTARVNLGVTLMCAINDQPLNLTGQNLWLDLYFAGYSLNQTSTWVLPKDLNYVNETGDIHAGYFVGEVHPEDFAKWISMRVDLGDYVSRTLDLITKINIKTIRVYGFILFVECLGAYAEVEYDYVRAVRT